jgi:16S rRNA (guanine966-N2)-methyltransferase
VRVIAGSARGRTLKAPKGMDVRPTSDKVRGAIFNILGSWPELSVEGARVLDLFAGTGALGIEALSRGAAHATFVERDRHALAALRANLEATGFDASSEVVERDAEKLADAGKFRLVFVDPPYDLVARSRAIASLASRLEPGGIAVVEHATRDPSPAVPGLAAADARRYGSTAVTFYRSV